MSRLDALKLGPSAGGKAVKSKVPPAECDLCGRSTAGWSWHKWLGHLCIHRRAEKLGITYAEMAKTFVRDGLKALDPVPQNGAWQRWGR